MAEARSRLLLPVDRDDVGRSIAGWQAIVAGSGSETHMAIVGHRKAEDGTEHRHANALVG